MKLRGAVVTVGCAVLLSSCSPPGNGTSQPTEEPSSGATTVTVTPKSQAPATKITKVNPIASNGTVLDSYNVKDLTDAGTVDAATCADPSSYASSEGTYACATTALGADACWLEQPNHLLCTYDPWSQDLTRIRLSDRPKSTPAPDDSQPLALETDDGSRYRVRNGMGGLNRSDGFADLYECSEGPCENDEKLSAVLANPDGQAIDQTSDAWTVLVGGQSGKPKQQRVTRAWFISAK